MQNPPESRPPQNSLIDWLLGFFRPFFTKTQSASEENVEENIRENEEKYRIIFEQSSDGILLIKDVIIECNDKAAQILGYLKEEIIGKTPADFSPPTQENGNRTNQKQEEIWAKAYAGEPQRFNWRCRRCDGDIVEMEVRLKAIHVKGQPALLAVGRDITELKQAETKQLETQALLEAAVAQSPSGILIADAPAVAIRMANPAALGIRGGSMELLTGIEVRHHATKWQTFRPDGTPYPSEELPLSRAVLKGEITRNEEVIIRDEENNDHWVNVNAAPIRDSRQEIIAGIVIFHDVTKQKMVENTLQDNKTFLHSLLDAIPIPVFYKDTQGRYLGFNKAFENFFGKRKLELVGKSVFDTYPKHLADIYHAKDMELLEYGGTQHYEYQITSASGLRDAIFDKAVFHDSQGNINGIIGTILDVTEQKQAVDALRENEQFLSNILESIQDGVSVLNPDLTIRHANGIMETWYADQLPLEGKKCFSCYQNADAPCSPCPTLRC
ncbi:PAS domain S-box protein, partial [bacterium]|nr:PAS domain S-box protein [bacterium]